MIDNIKDDNVHEWIGDCQKDRLKRHSIFSEFDKEGDSLTSKFPKIYILWVSLFSLCAGGDGVEPSYLPHRWMQQQSSDFPAKNAPIISPETSQNGNTTFEDKQICYKMLLHPNLMSVQEV